MSSARIFFPRGLVRVRSPPGGSWSVQRSTFAGSLLFLFFEQRNDPFLGPGGDPLVEGAASSLPQSQYTLFFFFWYAKSRDY